MDSAKHYVEHLAEVNKTNKVILAEDIFNQRGVLVVKKGSEVDLEFAKKIAKHKLVKSLDNSISLTNLLKQKDISNTLTLYLHELYLFDFAQSNGLYQETILLFSLLDNYPEIMQKLTILSERLPHVFGRTLVMSVFTTGLCNELNQTHKTKENVFLACLISEVGMLHIDPLLIDKRDYYNPDELKMLQGHVVIAKHFTDMVQSLPSIVGRAVLEHHERADGFGYPLKKTLPKLCIEGQILAMVDKVSVIARKLRREGHYSLTSVIAALQVPSTQNCQELHNAMLRLIKFYPFKYKSSFSQSEFKDLVVECIEKRSRLNLWFQEYSRIYVDHEALLQDSDAFKPLSLLNKLDFIITTSGILNDAQHEWLEAMTVNLDPLNFVELEELYFALDEIEDQCFFVMKKLVEHKEDVIELFNDEELPNMYYEGLSQILGFDRIKRFI